MGIPVQIVGDGIDWPAWVQAVGSVVAILTAIWVSHWEAERTRNERLEDRQELRRAIAGLARRLADLIERDANAMINSPLYFHHEGFSSSEYKLLEAALDRFDPSKLVSAEAVIALEELRRAGSSAPFFADMVAEVAIGDRYEEDPDESVRNWAGSASEAAGVLEKLARSRR